MSGEGEGRGGWPAPPPLYLTKDEQWSHFDDSVNAVSFGFVATAILISMFLLMAIFEKFLRTTSPDLSPPTARRPDHLIAADAKPPYHPSPKAMEVYVVMPGENVPTFIAHPALDCVAHDATSVLC
ncbi:uncharacterized protein LOC121803096 [Salvia splendens]|uniref:uncharacterized protein LOC121803096 n=1 Tax=Salvia splendens TaxID=180675 RepID=UPI001C26177C|nr:uncharacterized protein LOC121803096 [Salvia splendens]